MFDAPLDGKRLSDFGCDSLENVFKDDRDGYFSSACIKIACFGPEPSNEIEKECGEKTKKSKLLSDTESKQFEFEMRAMYPDMQGILIDPHVVHYVRSLEKEVADLKQKFNQTTNH